MKKIFNLILILLISTIMYSKEISFFGQVDVKNYYCNNILKLSSHDISRFKDGNETDKFKIDTIDDLITSAKCELGIRHKAIAGHTQIDLLEIRYNKYWNNDIKNEGNISFSIKQFFSRKLNIAICYSYYPEIYLNRYESVLDEEAIYRDFTYSKNVYNGRIFWKFHSIMNLKYELTFSQLFYNKYFTEYDADNIENLVGLNIKLDKKVRVNLNYYYKNSNADAEKAFNDIEDISVVKDASYGSNKYEMIISVPDLLFLFSKPILLNSSFNYVIRYFQSENENDEFHYAREDNIINLKANIKYSLNKRSKLSTFYKYEKRDASSPFKNVERDKTYSLYEAGFVISCSI